MEKKQKATEIIKKRPLDEVTESKFKPKDLPKLCK